MLFVGVQPAVIGKNRGALIVGGGGSWWLTLPIPDFVVPDSLGPS